MDGTVYLRVSQFPFNKQINNIWYRFVISSQKRSFLDKSDKKKYLLKVFNFKFQSS